MTKLPKWQGLSKKTTSRKWQKCPNDQKDKKAKLAKL